ncbi:hypothetical protein BGZ54_005094, partial [Gamsiella multidivaricata]
MPVGRLLQLKDLTAAVRVCKAWHNAMTPLIWRTLSFDTPLYITSTPLRVTAQSSTTAYSTYKAPSPEAIERNAALIRKITVSRGSQQHPADHAAQNAALRYCSNILSLEILKSDAYRLNQLCAIHHTDEHLWQDVTPFVLRNRRSIHTIVIHRSRQTPSNEFMEAVLDIACLREFTTAYCHYRAQTLAQLLVVHGSNLEILALEGDVIQHCDNSSLAQIMRLVQLNRLRELRIEKLDGNMDIDSQLQLIQRAPNLIKLTWDLGRYPFPDQDVFCQIVSETCPGIERYVLIAASQDFPTEAARRLYPSYIAKEPTPKDRTLAKVLDLSKTVTQFDVLKSSFGPQSMAALRRHFSVLTTLKFEACSLFTSTMAQECLSSTPLLRSFTADRISAHDIIRGIDSEQKGQSSSSWVCLGLTVLVVSIVDLPDVSPRTLEFKTSPVERQRNFQCHAKVLLQLSRLERLVLLFVGYNSGLAHADYLTDRPRLGIKMDGICLKPEAGLYQLQTLKKLRFFNVDRVPQDLSMEEVKWIHKAWPSL